MRDERGAGAGSRGWGRPSSPRRLDSRGANGTPWGRAVTPVPGVTASSMALPTKTSGGRLRGPLEKVGEGAGSGRGTAEAGRGKEGRREGVAVLGSGEGVASTEVGFVDRKGPQRQRFVGVVAGRMVGEYDTMTGKFRALGALRWMSGAQFEKIGRVEGSEGGKTWLKTVQVARGRKMPLGDWLEAMGLPDKT